jgi:predicted RNase H-like HicB family nuclease
MAADLVENRLSDPGTIHAATWLKYRNAVYECRVLLCPEDGGYVAYALRLPGVATQGDTLEEAVENIKDALQAALQEYLNSSAVIPWRDNPLEHTKGCVERRVLVNV